MSDEGVPRAESPNPRKRAHPDGETDADQVGTAARAASDGGLSTATDIAHESGSPSSVTKKARIDEEGEEGRSGGELDGDTLMEDVKPAVGGSAASAPAATTAVQAEKLAVLVKKKLNYLEKQIADAEKRAKKEEEKRQKEEEKKKREEERAEEKRKKEGEKRQKEEERKRKEEEKAEEKRKKEEEREERKRLKDEERQKKEEEKQKKSESKKDKGQMSLSSFIAISKTKRTALSKEGTPDTDTVPAAQTGSASKSSSLSDYQHLFAPFYIKPHVTMAPRHRWGRNQEELRVVRKNLDEFLENQPSSGVAPGITFLNTLELCHTPSRKRSTRGVRLQHTVKDIMVQLRALEKSVGTAENPVDMTKISRQGKADYDSKITSLLKSVPMKYLSFHEDVRPPYRGTWTKQPSLEVVRSLSRNPTQRKLPNINYDYDSEAVWDPEEEGEDLDSDGEQEEIDDEDADDMEGFLDDEDADAAGSANKRRAVLSDLVPVCSGLCWGDAEGMNAELDNFKMEILLPCAQAPIDPFSTSYWERVRSVLAPDGESAVNGSTQKTIFSAMNPPRLPLNAIKGTNMATNILTNKQSASGSNKDVMVAAGDLEKFKAAVQGSDLTKTGLIEVLKKKFPDNSKTAIKNTLNTIAERVGTREADKRWTLINGA